MPVPDAPLRIVTKDALLVAVQLQLAPWSTTTFTVVIRAAEGSDRLVGDTENAHAGTGTGTGATPVATTTTCAVPVAF